MALANRFIDFSMPNSDGFSIKMSYTRICSMYIATKIMS